MLPEGQSNPATATGLVTGGEVALYQSSGLGPAALNPSAPAGSPELCTDPAPTNPGCRRPSVTGAVSALV